MVVAEWERWPVTADGGAALGLPEWPGSLSAWFPCFPSAPLRPREGRVALPQAPSTRPPSPSSRGSGTTCVGWEQERATCFPGSYCGEMQRETTSRGREQLFLRLPFEFPGRWEADLLDMLRPHSASLSRATQSEARPPLRTLAAAPPPPWPRDFETHRSLGFAWVLPVLFYCARLALLQ